MHQSPVFLEVVCFNIEGVLAAVEGGADRIELCAGPAEGGITPSLATIEFCKKHVSIPVYVMIRPRGGDFLYTSTEAELMKRDIEICRSSGIAGVVFGALNDNGSVNITLCKELVETAGGMGCTFHRAFDMTDNPLQAIDDIVSCGFERILTSGRKSRAADAVDELKNFVNRAAGRISIMPGGGVDMDAIGELVKNTSIREYHVSARKYIRGSMIYRNPALHISNPPEDDHRHLTVSADLLRNIRFNAESALHA